MAPGGSAAGAGDAGTPKARSDRFESLPDVLTKLSPAGAVARLDKASRRGKLAGFHKGDRKLRPGETAPEAGVSSPPVRVCSVAAHGEPFDKTMDVMATKDPGDLTRLSFRLWLPWKAPTLLAIALLVTIWPGEPVTDSFLRHHWSSYGQWTNPDTGTWFRTWIWYYPLAIIGAIWAWVSILRKTEQTTRAKAREVIDQIADATGGDVVAPRLRR